MRQPGGIGAAAIREIARSPAGALYRASPSEAFRVSLLPKGCPPCTHRRQSCQCGCCVRLGIEKHKKTRRIARAGFFGAQNVWEDYPALNFGSQHYRERISPYPPPFFEPFQSQHPDSETEYMREKYAILSAK